MKPGKLAGLRLSPPRRSTITDPERIFSALTLRGDVQNIWGPQAEALGQWDENRASPDVVIEMNTGGGKTLIGLLAAQSLVNETRGNVLYVCPTKQLVEQASLRADECGMEVATYMSGSWTAEDVFRDARGPCTTNYAALFNGKSIFRREPLAGIILDDAHVAAPSIRGQFTLRLKSGSSAFRGVVALFRPHFERNGYGQQLAALLRGDWVPLLFVPAFELNRHWQALTQVLVDHDVPNQEETCFAWEYLRDRLDRCTVLLGASGIEITPVCLPLASVPQFVNARRRIYLTATVPSVAQFRRTFGVGEPCCIRPGGKSGEAQRLFIFAVGDTDHEQATWAKALLDERKACIICPSDKACRSWTDWAQLYDGQSGQSGLEKFKQAAAPTRLVLSARYDGIDLPGDSCRILVLDRLPFGTSLFDRFMDEGLGIESLRSSSTGLRLTQGIGRIFRSNTDHGVVVLVGRELQNWVRNPAHQAFLPPLLQAQIQLGMQFRDAVDQGRTNYEGLVDGILTGDRDWDRLYESHIGQYDVVGRPQPPSWLAETALKEHGAFAKMWANNWPGAAQELACLVDATAANDRRLAAWYQHWLGFCQERSNDSAAAASYLAAASVRSELGRPTISSQSIVASVIDAQPGAQATAIAALLKDRRRLRRLLESVEQNLKYGPDTGPAEQALADLGSLLGLAGVSQICGHNAVSAAGIGV